MKSLADQAIAWQDDHLVLLDQRKLPNDVQFIHCLEVVDVVHAIKDMVVRGAPAIGVTAAFGVVLAARARYKQSADNWQQLIEQDLRELLLARPTAVNLQWAIEKMRDEIANLEGVSDGIDPEPVLLNAAQIIHQEDVRANKTLGDNGAALLNTDSVVLTHCNAGALATGGYGTALGVIRSAYAQEKISTIYADETRPWFQGTRLTAWELLQDNIPVTVLCDSAAASLMCQKSVAWVIVGADRVASNGDVANKIGTYSLAVMARQHNVKFMVAAPTSTIDMNIRSGGDIEIEERADSEIINLREQSIGPEQAEVWNPVFDITPAEFVTALVTEKGVIEQPNTSKIKLLMES
ncbi:MAG: S-methyl-5-thioribose-1-phosphate isomerase [Gammaproteobacteria bacterium]